MLLQLLSLFTAGFFGGILNSIAGGGSFITFPALLFFGVPPISANATNTFASWLSWQGYLLFLIGGKNGAWAYANVGVIAALLIGFIGHILLSRKSIAEQESF